MSKGEEFWRFTLAVYGKAGVPQACIALQDRRGFNVNMLLFACFAAVFGHTLHSKDWRKAQSVAGPWQTDVIGPLRSVRRRLKAEKDNPDAQALGKRLLDLEIEGERIEQQHLAELLPPTVGDPSPRIAAANLRRLCSRRGIKPTVQDVADLTAILTAAFPDLPPLAAVWLLLP